LKVNLKVDFSRHCMTSCCLVVDKFKDTIRPIDAQDFNSLDCNEICPFFARAYVLQWFAENQKALYYPDLSSNVTLSFICFDTFDC